MRKQNLSASRTIKVMGIETAIQKQRDNFLERKTARFQCT
jgi:hypothetical protein